jgi:hypothetical protein
MTFTRQGSLAAYLSIPEKDRSGDEANIVDVRISRVLLEALGYTGSEIDLQCKQGKFEARLRCSHPRFSRMLLYY